MGERSAQAEWRKSTYSAEINCVEFRRESSSAVGLRDSKDTTGPHLRVSVAAWIVFRSAMTSAGRPSAG
ncbi:DUF397 domain-containing protein [Catenuloplanes sp. NPDC051500]|uniref:DUF397 domain-containing protein n=1 Tax=Catenuloplanes sp. NPDC051500 TaxID=3363959 RepID=UPI00378E2A6F